MTQIDVDQFAVGLARDAQTLACARPDQLASVMTILDEAQDEIARALSKAQRHTERLAA